MDKQYICVPYGSHNKHRLFFPPHIINVLNFVAETYGVLCVVQTNSYILFRSSAFTKSGLKVPRDVRQ
jgi:hypothetical protein